jgi:hypothetical protein
MFLIAERCRRQGDLDMAANCYQETHLLCPDCVYGRKAIERLHALETRRVTETAPAEAEEQESPKPEQGSFLRDKERHPRAIAIELEESSTAPDAGEEQEAPAAPVLSVPRPPRNLTIHVDEPETYGATSLLQRAEDVLQAATGIDLDLEIARGRNGSGVRAQGSVQLGQTGYKLIYEDDDGHYKFVVVPWRP